MYVWIQELCYSSLNKFACYVQGTAGLVCEMLIVAESSDEWGLFWGPSE